jgi:hypothetical protein
MKRDYKQVADYFDRYWLTVGKKSVHGSHRLKSPELNTFGRNSRKKRWRFIG